MNKLSYQWILGLLYSGLITIFLFFRGAEYVFFNQLLYLIAPLTALLAGFITISRLGWQGKRADVLKHILLALSSWFLGELSLLYFIWKGIETSPSIADTFFIAGYIIFCRAILLKTRLYDLHWKTINPRLLAALFSLFILVVGLVSYIGARGYNPGESMLVNLTTFSWSVGDLVMGGLGLILLALLWQYREGSVKQAWMWFLGAVITNLIADTIYNLNPEVIVDGSWANWFLNMLWVGAYLMFAGYFLEIGGSYSQMSEAFLILAGVFALAALLVYMVMASQFESFLHPFIIMFTIPLSLIGIVAGLLIAGRPINLPVWIGLILLAGVAVNNAIVMIDYMNQLWRGGLDKKKAIVEGAVTRLRPVLLTALTTILGMLPMALSRSDGSEFRAPMAVTVLGGLTATTFLTLFVIPIIYSMFEKVSFSDAVNREDRSIVCKI